jgi:signal peptidase I
MLPAFRDGDFVLVCKIPFLFDRLRQGDVIAFRHKEYGTMIKKVQDLTPGEGEVNVIGTQENSVDSRRFGPIPYKDILGKVIWHIKKP